MFPPGISESDIYRGLRIPIRARAAPRISSTAPATPIAGVIAGLIGRPPAYVDFVPFCDAEPEVLDPSSEGTVVGVDVDVGVDPLVEEAEVFVDDVVAVADCVSVVAVGVSLEVLSAVVVASGSSRIASLAMVSTSRRSNSTAGAAMIPPK